MKKVILAVLLASSFGVMADTTILKLDCVKKVELDSKDKADGITQFLDLELIKDNNNNGYMNSEIVTKDGVVKSFTYYKSGSKGDMEIYTTRKQGDSPSSDADTMLLSFKNSGSEDNPIYSMGILKTRNEQTQEIQPDNIYWCMFNKQ